MSINIKFLLLISLFTININIAEAKSFYEQKSQLCNTIMKNIDINLSKITDRDRIKDNKNMLKANLWAISYEQHNCNPEPFINSLRRNLK